MRDGRKTALRVAGWRGGPFPSSGALVSPSPPSSPADGDGGLTAGGRR